MKRVVMWKRLDTVGAEYAEIEAEPLRLRGDVVLVEEGEGCAASYRVECDAQGATARAEVSVRRAGATTRRVLARTADGRWTVDGAPAPHLDGIADVDLSITPSTNTLPLRRLRLAIGASTDVVAAWVRFPELDVVPLPQTYRRESATTYAYASRGLGFTASIECDDDAIVRRYGALWARVD